MTHTGRNGKINVKLIVILVTVVAVLGVGAFVARHVRRKILAERDLKAGLAAGEKKDYRRATKHLREYLGRRPDDVEILRKYARWLLLAEPMEAGDIARSAAAYRRLLNLAGDEVAVYERLAKLYAVLGDYSELSYTADKWRKAAPKDPKAAMWCIRALLGQRKFDDARAALIGNDGTSKKPGGLLAELEKDKQRHPEYVQVCAMLGQDALRRGGPNARGEAKEWADRAIVYAPKSAEARLFRAGILRAGATPDNAERDKLLAAARKDLAAEALKPREPGVLLALCGKWLAHGELDKAGTALHETRKIDRDVLRKEYIDPSIFLVDQFSLAALLAKRRQAAAEGVSLADAALKELTARSHRMRILPTAVRLYLGGGKVDQARKALDEYLELRKLSRQPALSAADVGALKAAVARAEDRPYRVIDLLEPLVVSDPSNLGLRQGLGEAYSQTGQTRRAIRAFLEGLRIKPNDPGLALRLAHQYRRQRDWGKALTMLKRLQAPADRPDVNLDLLRIETAVFAALEQPAGKREVLLKPLGDELAALRGKHADRVDIRLLQAAIAFRPDAPDDAIKELELAIKECKEPLAAERRLARIYVVTNRLDKAARVCRNTCKRHPQSADAWEGLANALRAKRQPKEALAALAEGLKTVTEPAAKRQITLRLAVSRLTEGDPKGGIDLLKGLARQDKGDIRARELLLVLREIRRDEPTAQKLINEIREVQGEGGLRWRLQQAALYLAGPNWRSKEREITALLEGCTKADPGWSVPALMLADFQVTLGNLDGAVQTCRDAFRANPAALRVADRLAMLLQRQGRHGEAKEVLDRAEDRHGRLSNSRIRVALGSGELDEAADELKLRARNNDQDAASRIRLASLVYRQTGDQAKATRYLDEARDILKKLRESPADAVEAISVTNVRVEIIRVEAARLLAESRQLKEAGKAAEAQGPQDEAQKLRAEARALLDSHVAQDKNFLAHLLRGAFLVRIGELDSAEKDYLQLIKFTDEKGRGYERLGYFYAATGKLDKAVDTLEKGAKLYPEDLAITRRLMRTLLDRSESMWRKSAAGQRPTDQDR